MRAFFLLLLLLLLPLKVYSEVKSVRIGFGSCWSSPDDTVWETIESENFARFLLLGDNIYLLEEKLYEPQIYKTTYDQLFLGAHFQKLLKSTPLSAIWDDHDFGPNNSDSTFKRRAHAEDMFRKYWKIEPRPENFSRGIHRIVYQDFVKIILTDNRSFRKNPGLCSSGKLFGEAQLDWIEEEIQNAAGYFVILASGGQLLTKGPFHEDLGEYKAEEKRLISILTSSPVPVIILSGDRHFADINERNSLLEVTSSPLSGRVAGKNIVTEQPGRIKLYREGPNFGALTVDKLAKHYDVTAQIYDDSGTMVIEHKKRYIK